MSPETPVVHGLRRSLTLLRVFLVASAAILAAGAVGLSSVLSSTIEEQQVADETGDIALYANAVLSPVLIRGDDVVVNLAALRALSGTVRLPEEVRSVKIWARDGTLVLATLAPERMGRVYPLEGRLGDVLRSGTAQGRLEQLDAGARAAQDAEATMLDLDEALVVYAPVSTPEGETVGAFEVVLDPVSLRADVAAVTMRIWVAVVFVFAALYVLLALLVRNASRRLQHQNDELEARALALSDSYDRLERGSLEMVETLNATVEARDPYTAGHSQRVRQISLAIGRRLSLGGEQLAVLGVAALFHDVGKIALPDEILTKPKPLTVDEFALMRQHPARGAEIVSKLSDLADAVPVIRHHHERWDGRGYPDLLAGEAIPLEAAVVALADAWDAMTTDRPYAAALPLSAALAEVVDGRGTQFSPSVVDAFFEVIRHGRDELPGTVGPLAKAG